MIDFHTHVLPGIDDGSPDMMETEKLLWEEHQQGVTTVIATPHFYASRSSVSHFLEKRGRAYEKVQAFAKDKDWVPRILKGTEVYFFPGMGKAAQLPELTIEGTDLLLLEMPFGQWTGAVYREVKEIIEKQKLTVVLAHIERFYEFQKDRSVLEDVLDLPVYLQINTGSLLRWQSRRLDRRILELGLPTILASDCHNMAHRPPNMTQGREVLRRKMGEGILQKMDETAERLLRDHGAVF